MPPRLSQRVKIHNPGPGTIDPISGNPVPGAPVVRRVSAYLSQRPVENLSSAIELNGEQTTVMSLWTLLVAPHTDLRPDSVIEDAFGHKYEVEGDPAERGRAIGAGRVIYIAAALRRISDWQGAV